MGTRWEEVLCSFFQFLIAISFFRASWGTVPSLCICRGFEAGVSPPICKGPSTSSCWVLFCSLSLPSMQILQRGGCVGAAPVYLFADFCCILWKCQCSSAIENNSSAPKTNELISFQKTQAKKKKPSSEQKQNLQKSCSFLLLECCSHCKGSNFKAIVLYTSILYTSNLLSCMGLWVRCVSVHKEQKFLFPDFSVSWRI